MVSGTEFLKPLKLVVFRKSVQQEPAISYPKATHGLPCVERTNDEASERSPKADASLSEVTEDERDMIFEKRRRIRYFFGAPSVAAATDYSLFHFLQLHKFRAGLYSLLCKPVLYYRKTKNFVCGIPHFLPILR